MIGKIDNKYAAAVELTKMVLDSYSYYNWKDVEIVYKDMRRLVEDEENNYKINSESEEDS